MVELDGSVAGASVNGLTIRVGSARIPQSNRSGKGFDFSQRTFERHAALLGRNLVVAKDLEQKAANGRRNSEEGRQVGSSSRV